MISGRLTLEIANVSNTPDILLHPGMPIGQLLLLEVSPASNAEPANEDLKGNLCGANFPGGTEI